MKRIIAITGIVFLISSCSSFDLSGLFASGGNESASGIQPTFSMQEQGDKGHWVAMPSNSGITIIGISSSMGIQAEVIDSEITAAKEDAARKIAMYHGVEGVVETSSGFDGRAYFGSVAEYRVELTYDQDYEKYIESLTFDRKTDVIKVDGVVFVRFHYVTSSPGINYTSVKSKGRPQWAGNRAPPQIDGYMTTVGTAQNQVRLKDTINKSIESAVATLVQELSTDVNSLDYTALSSGGMSGGGTSSAIATESRGKLDGFHVIEFWIDPQTKYVYTLAIARKSE